MAKFPLPLGLSGSEDLPHTKTNLINCFNNGNNRILPMPGRQLITSMPGIARAQFEWNGSLYQVRSSELIKITNLETGAYLVVGDIDGTEEVKVDVGFNEAVLVVKAANGSIYTLNTSDALNDITSNANFVSCRDLTFINGRFVYIPFDGSPAFYSDVGDAGSVQASSFFDAEELPDKNNSCFNGKNTLYICGENSIELFRNTGTDAAAFSRIQGARILNGVIGALLEYNNTFLFIGREKDQDAGIYSIVQGGAAKISNETIDLILSKYTSSQLENAQSVRFKWRGNDIAAFEVGMDSFAFFGGEWFTLTSLSNNLVTQQYTVGFITQFNNTYYTSSSTRFGKLAKINTDYGQVIDRFIEFSIEQENEEDFACQSLQLDISQGYNTEIGSVGLSLSNDAVVYGPNLFIQLGKIGQYSKKLKWNPPGGLGIYRGFMAVRIYTRDNVIFSANELNIDFK